MAAAGLRLGYMIGAAEVIAEVSKIKLPYNINFFTEHAASLILNNASIAEKTVRVIVDERDKLYQYLKSLPFDNVYESVANFLLIHFPETKGRTAKDADAFLSARGLILRQTTAYKLPNALRMTVGGEEANRLVVAALKDFMGQSR